jgi:hypothetical protein
MAPAVFLLATTSDMPSVASAVFTGIVVLLGVIYQVCLSPMLELSGAFRNVEPMNTERCEVVEGELSVIVRIKYYLSHCKLYLKVFRPAKVGVSAARRIN